MDAIQPGQFGTYKCDERVSGKSLSYNVLRLSGENSLNVILNRRGGWRRRGKKPIYSSFLPCSAPSVTAKPSSVVLPGQTVTLVCEASRTKSHQRPQIHWLDPQGGKTEQESCEVRASSRHSGRWTCVVTLGQKSHSAQMSITVVGG